MRDAPPSIVVLDDDPSYCEAITAYLEAQGCRVRTLTDPAQLDTTLATITADLLLLDQRLGHTTGTDVLLRVRETTNLPCIIVTGHSDVMDRIVNLEIGADDEVEKSIPPREMLARIRTVLRRSRATPQGGAVSQGDGCWQLSVARRELRRPDGSLCPLTTAEFDTLRLLYESAHMPVSRARLLEEVFGRRPTLADRAVDTVVRKLRAKLDPVQGDLIIKTIRNQGYMFVGFQGEAAP